MKPTVSVFSRQYAASGTAVSLDVERAYITNRVQLMCSTAGTAYVGNQNVATNNGMLIPGPAASPLVIEMLTPGDLYVIGSGTVTVLYEIPVSAGSV